MAISHGQSLHCSFMENTLSSLGEALKRINSDKLGSYLSDHAQMMQLYYNCVHRYGSKGNN